MFQGEKPQICIAPVVSVSIRNHFVVYWWYMHVCDGQCGFGELWQSLVIKSLVCRISSCVNICSLNWMKGAQRLFNAGFFVFRNVLFHRFGLLSFSGSILLGLCAVYCIFNTIYMKLYKVDLCQGYAQFLHSIIMLQDMCFVIHVRFKERWVWRYLSLGMCFYIVFVIRMTLDARLNICHKLLFVAVSSACCILL